MAIMNKTSSPVRFTPAAYMALVFVVSALITIWAFTADLPIIYLTMLFVSFATLMFTADLGSRYAKR